MRRLARTVGTLLIVAGLGTVGWAATVWLWEDPFTSLYTRLEQRELAEAYERRAARLDVDALFAAAPAGETALTAAQRKRLEALARRYRKTLRPGDAIGRLRVPALGVDMIMVEGTDPQSLKKGPGRYRRSYLPGEGELVYVAGHRTTYSAPFSRIDRLRKADRVFVELPYGTFEYRITGHRIVRATELSVLRSRRREVIALQACHPRFFASHRYIAYAQPVSVELGRRTFRLGEAAVAAGA